jgi:hypothetical protein
MPEGPVRHGLAPKYVDVRPGPRRAATPQGECAFYLLAGDLATAIVSASAQGASTGARLGPLWVDLGIIFAGMPPGAARAHPYQLMADEEKKQTDEGRATEKTPKRKPPKRKVALICQQARLNANSSPARRCNTSSSSHLVQRTS